VTNLRIALVVPTSEYCYDEATLLSWIRAGEVDLVVFPENFLEASSGKAALAAARKATIVSARELAESLQAPVLTGVWCSDVIDERGMQCAGYWNPNPGRRDTREHFYAKHSTSEVLPYELRDYTALRDQMFAPIQLKGRKLGVQLCHDQFFGLVAARLVREGADVLFDLTGDSVVRAKWFNVASGRSLEHQLPYFCTMSRSESETTNNVALALGFRNGAEIAPTRKKESRKNGDLALYEIDGKVLPRFSDQAYSPISYNDITLALTPSTAKASLRVGLNGLEGVVRGSWQRLSAHRGNVGVLSLPAESLRDPLCVHAHESGESSFEANIVCFTGSRDVLNTEDAIMLARLRAIEHRVAVVICTPSVREVIKTSRFKNIQRMRECGGVFGLDLKFLGGTYATMEGNSRMGIPKEYHQQYRDLLDLAADQEGQ
jgi:predicted amidohydrolase